MSLEFMMNALRLSQGVDIRTYEDRTGLSVNQIEPVLRKLKEQKLIKNSREKICPTKKGHMFLNSTLEAFFEK
jgi:oxygen-independent coproporphyrinogen-3 oxidase